MRAFPPCVATCDTLFVDRRGTPCSTHSCTYTQKADLGQASHALSPTQPYLYHIGVLSASHFHRHCRRDRASVRQFLEGKASVYALIAKDQLMSFQDLSCSACAARERAEVEASARSQREAAEAMAAGAPQTAQQRRRGAGSSALADTDGAKDAVAAASSLADGQMDEHWRAVSVCSLSCRFCCFCPATSSCVRSVC